MVALDTVQKVLVIYMAFVIPPLWYAAGYITKHYAEPDTPKSTFATLRLGFFVSFALVFTIPIDIASVVVDRRENVDPQGRLYTNDEKVISVFYNVFYLTVLTLSMVLSFQEYLNTDGYFTRGARLWSSTKRMILDIVPAAILGIPALFLMKKAKIIDGTVAGLKLFSQLAMNTIYSVLVMFLLGYGLVEFPRLLWNTADVQNQLLKAQTKAATEFSANMDARNELSAEVASVLKTRDKLGTSDPILTEAMTIMTSECPSEFRNSKHGEVAVDKSGNITIHTLAQLRTRMNMKKSNYRMAQARLEATQMGAYNLEDMVLAKNKPSQKVIFWTLRNVNSSESEYAWLLEKRPRYYKYCACFCMLLSFLSFMGIISSMGELRVSVYFSLVHSSSKSEQGSLFGIIIFVFITLFYMIITIVWALFQMRSLFELVPERTTPAAISTANRMIGTLAFPICFFYLGWLGENGIKDGDWMYYEIPRNTSVPITNANGTVTGIEWKMEKIYMPPAFTAFYPMASVPAIKDSYGVVYPMLLFLFLTLMLTKAYNRLCVAVKMPTWQFGDPITTQEQLDEGMRQLQRFKKIAERTVQRQELTLKRMGEKAVDYPGLKICGIWIFRPRAAKKANLVIKSLSSSSGAKVHIPSPAALHGNMHYKCAQRGRIKLKWVEIYVVVKEPGILFFAKNETAAENNEVESFLPSPVDLTVVLDFSAVLKDDKEGYRLKIELVADCIKLRLDSEEEMVKWKRGLNEWKEYCATCDMIRGDVGRTLVPPKGDAPDIEQGVKSIELVSMNPLLPPSSPKLESIIKNANKNQVEQTAINNMSTPKSKTDQTVDVPRSPANLEGYLYKKRNSNLSKIPAFSKFQERYFRVDEKTGELQYFKENCEGPDVPLGSIDLAAILEVSAFVKEAKADGTRFNVVSADGAGDNKVYKLKANSIPERMLWVTGLNAWREFFIMRYSVQQASVYSPPPTDDDALDASDALDALNDFEMDQEDEDPPASEYGSEYSSVEENGLEGDTKNLCEENLSFEEKPSESGNLQYTGRHDTAHEDFDLDDGFDAWAGKNEQISEEVKSVDSVSAAFGISSLEKAVSNMTSNPMRKLVFSANPTHESNQNMLGLVDDEANDEDAYIKSMAKKYSKIAPQSTPLPKFVMPKFNLGKIKK